MQGNLPSHREAEVVLLWEEVRSSSMDFSRTSYQIVSHRRKVANNGDTIVGQMFVWTNPTVLRGELAFTGTRCYLTYLSINIWGETSAPAHRMTSRVAFAKYPWPPAAESDDSKCTPMARTSLADFSNSIRVTRALVHILRRALRSWTRCDGRNARSTECRYELESFM